jgi:predicted nucleotidyltransferase
MVSLIEGAIACIHGTSQGLRSGQQRNPGLSALDPVLGIKWPLPVIGLSPRDTDLARIDDNFMDRILDRWTTMRITEKERAEITQTVTRRDPSASIYLFGSRVDDNARGGDLDLLVLSMKIGLLERLDILADLHRNLGEQKIDLVIYPDLSKPFARITASEGILL